MQQNKSIKKDLPKVILRNEDREYEGTLGSYCWKGICVDYTNPSLRTDLREKLKIQKNGKIAFSVKDYAKPKRFQITIFSGRNGKTILNKTIEEGQEIKLDVERGTYTLSVMTLWDKEGDITYIFPVEAM